MCVYVCVIAIVYSVLLNIYVCRYTRCKINASYCFLLPLKKKRKKKDARYMYVYMYIYYDTCLAIITQITLMV